MPDSMQLMQGGIIRDMTEGVMTIDLRGLITLVNPAACNILCMEKDALEGHKFSECFFEYGENDAFNQTVMDAVYDSHRTHENFVPYFTGEKTVHLHIRTSFQRNNDAKVGIIVVFSDISELMELRDALKAMERIRALNQQLSLRNDLLAETFGRYVSDELVRELLETPGGLVMGGKKQELTVMMSDLRGFTALCEKMEPQALVTMLNHYLGAMTEIIQEFRGTIIEFIGDGIMTIFGAPVFFPNHAESAVAAAIKMQAAMEDVNCWNLENGYPVLEMGIGVNTGEMIVGNIGSKKRTKYGVTGSEVNLCGRIESYTVGGQILISPRTRQQIAAKLGIAAEQTVLPKGVTEPITISQVNSIGAPYNLSYTLAYEEAVPLPSPVAVEFFQVEEKHIGKKMLRGEIVALSADEAKMRAETNLRVHENLQLLIGEKLLCKVTGIENDAAVLRFTARPTNFKEWLSTCRNK